jgi:hypothetical protein
MNKRVLSKLESIVSVSAAFAVMYGFAIRSLVLAFDVFIPASFDSTMFYVMQGMVVLSMAGSLSSYRRHRKPGPPLIAVVSGAAVIYGINSQLDINYMFPGMVGMLAASAWNSIELRRAEQSEAA